MAVTVAVLAFPLSVFAVGGVKDLIKSASGLVTDTLLPLAFSLCLLYFFWGVAKYVKNSAGSEKAAEDGKRVMVWGIVGLFVAFSIWGIIKFIESEIGLPDVKIIAPI